LAGIVILNADKLSSTCIVLAYIEWRGTHSLQASPPHIFIKKIGHYKRKEVYFRFVNDAKYRVGNPE